MKFMQKQFPVGSFDNQETNGAYIDEFLANNLDIFAKKIVNDMHFLILISGNDSVGNGKTTLATQIACYLTNKINEIHNKDLTFISDNMFLNAKSLVENSFNNPKYSINVLDEGDDLVTHGMKETAVQLKRYFRKCRQLNQILILIIPSFFELPKFYALARSHCLINVKFFGEFDRGVFDFYGPTQKKKLYLFGKRDWNYDASSKDFSGRFLYPYLFFPNIKEEIIKYKKKKYDDMLQDAKEEEAELGLSKDQIERAILTHIIKKMIEKFPQINKYEIAEAVGLTDRTLRNYLSDDYSEKYTFSKIGKRK